jgi:acyl-coenzyme A thioesterase PaaI-like protein
VEKKHLNGMGNVHGGCFMTFADYCLFALASRELQGPGITVSFACEFLDAAREGDLIECDGEMTRVGGSLIFLRGMLKSGERALFTFSGTIKRVKKRPQPDAIPAPK